MKVWQKRAISSALVLALALILTYLFSHLLPPKGSVPQRSIVSYCVGDATNDGRPELLAISGDGKTDAGERHGGLLLVCGASAEADLVKLGFIPPEKIRYSIDLSGIKPMKVQLGDINGDGANEVAICVYKKAKFHPVMTKRPFFFDLAEGNDPAEGNLIPVWLGSRLSRPFDDYILYDINEDAADEIVSIERLESGKRVIAAYIWKGFGFEVLAQSDEFDGELRFDPETDGHTAETNGHKVDAKDIHVIFSNNREHSKLNLRLSSEKLVSQ